MSTQTRVGTSHFVDTANAYTYYGRQGIDAAGVRQKIAEGEISIGPPPIKPGQGVVIVDGGTRYAIVERDPTDQEVLDAIPGPTYWDMAKKAYATEDRLWFPCSEAFYQDMLGVVPPTYVGKWWACGEAWKHTQDGQEVLLFFRARPGYACRMATAKEIIAEQAGRSQGHSRKLFNAAQLEAIRLEFGKLNGVSVHKGGAGEKMLKFLDGLPQPMLDQLAGANIKFLSALARNRVTLAGRGDGL